MSSKNRCCEACRSKKVLFAPEFCRGTRARAGDSLCRHSTKHQLRSQVVATLECDISVSHRSVAPITEMSSVAVNIACDLVSLHVSLALPPSLSVSLLPHTVRRHRGGYSVAPGESAASPLVHRFAREAGDPHRGRPCHLGGDERLPRGRDRSGRNGLCEDLRRQSKRGRSRHDGDACLGRPLQGVP